MRLLRCYPNIYDVEKIKSPVFIMHGTKDCVIPVGHGKAIYGKIKETCQGTVGPLWLEGKGHNDIFYEDWEILRSLKEFIDTLSGLKC